MKCQKYFYFSFKKLLVAGGYGGRKGNVEDTTEIYSYNTKEWRESGKLPNKMFEAVISNIDNRVFLFVHRSSEILEYDIALESWSSVGLLKKVRKAQRVTPVKFSDYSAWCTF